MIQSRLTVQVHFKGYIGQMIILKGYISLLRSKAPSNNMAALLSSSYALEECTRNMSLCLKYDDQKALDRSSESWLMIRSNLF